MADCKLEYITLSGRVKFQNARIKESQIQMADGNHFVTNDCVTFDPAGKGPAVITIFQGISSCSRKVLDQALLGTHLYENTVNEQYFKPPSVNKMWVRMFQNTMDWLMANGMKLFLLLLVAAVSLTAILGGR